MPPDLRMRARVIILASTYGDGDEPASAKGFLAKLEAMQVPPAARLAVLGFGDSSFPSFCGYAQRISHARRAKGWPQLLAIATVDRQSPQDFARWGRELGAALGLPLDLVHQPVSPATDPLTLVSRRDYGAEVQAPSAILRFSVPKSSLWQRLTGAGFARFEAGDLLGVMPEGSTMPRFYSLASSAATVSSRSWCAASRAACARASSRRWNRGRRRQAFLRPNPAFQRWSTGSAPLILIGAGTGIGPLAGFVRANARRRPIHLFFGMRHPGSDFLYGEELQQWQAEGRLAQPRHRRLARQRGHTMCRMHCGLKLQSVARLIAQRRTHHGLRRARHGGRRRRGAGRDPRTRRADARDAEGGGTLCRRRLLISRATP